MPSPSGLGLSSSSLANWFARPGLTVVIAGRTKDQGLLTARTL